MNIRSILDKIEGVEIGITLKIEQNKCYILRSISSLSQFLHLCERMNIKWSTGKDATELMEICKTELERAHNIGMYVNDNFVLTYENERYYRRTYTSQIVEWNEQDKS